MKKLLILAFLFSTLTFAQQLESKKIFSIDVSVGDFSKDGDYLSNQILYAPYTKGEFSGITNGEVLPIGGDFGTFYVKHKKHRPYRVNDVPIDRYIHGILQDPHWFCNASR